ncbi:hypothetical protein [Acetobacter syzygii]|uniref:hypothetical protein n=1 Tax=Acetobacter syzygii TaxID=146476 RepID=UPI0039E7D354
MAKLSDFCAKKSVPETKDGHGSLSLESGAPLTPDKEERKPTAEKEPTDEISLWLSEAVKNKKNDTEFPLVTAFREHFGLKNLELMKALCAFGTEKYAEELLENRYKRNSGKPYDSNRFRPLFCKLKSDIEQKLRSGDLIATAIDNGMYSLDEREELSKEFWNLHNVSGYPIGHYHSPFEKITPPWRDIQISMPDTPQKNNVSLNSKNQKELVKNKGGRPSKHDWAQISAIFYYYMIENGEPDLNMYGEQARAVEFIQKALSALNVMEPSDSDLRAWIKDTSAMASRLKKLGITTEN